MGEFFQFLSTNSTATTMFLAGFGAIIVVLMSVFVVAFAQGREIDLWPPKIGPKPLKFDEASSSAYQRTPFRGSEVEVDPEQIKKASSIDWMSYTLLKTIPQYYDEFRECLRRGGKIRFLVMDPQSSTPDVLVDLKKSLASGTGRKVSASRADYVDEVNTTLRKVQDLLETIPGSNIEVRLLIGQPPYKLTIINGTDPRNGYAQLAPTTVEQFVQIPVIELQADMDVECFDFFRKEFDRYWAVSRAWTPTAES